MNVIMDEINAVDQIAPNKMNLIKYEEPNNQLSLSERDLYLVQIEEQIKERRNLILQKTKAIEKKQKVNHFLEGVANDYKKYYEYIVNEKQKQYEYMQLLQTYLDDLMKTEKLAHHELKHAKRDQREILREMDTIKSELDKFVSS